jgi:hypothetical protein
LLQQTCQQKRPLVSPACRFHRPWIKTCTRYRASHLALPKALVADNKWRQKDIGLEKLISVCRCEVPKEYLLVLIGFILVLGRLWHCI